MSLASPMLTIDPARAAEKRFRNLRDPSSCSLLGINCTPAENCCAEKSPHVRGKSYATWGSSLTTGASCVAGVG
jgi:hypothetical protein